MGLHRFRLRLLFMHHACFYIESQVILSGFLKGTLKQRHRRLSFVTVPLWTLIIELFTSKHVFFVLKRSLVFLEREPNAVWLCDTHYYFYSQKRKVLQKEIKILKTFSSELLLFSFHRWRAFNPEITMQCLHSAATIKATTQFFSFFDRDLRQKTCNTRRCQLFRNFAILDFARSTFDFYRLIIGRIFFRLFFACFAKAINLNNTFWIGNVEQMLIMIGMEWVE